MTVAATLRCHLCIIRAVESPFRYPSKEELLQKVRDTDVKCSKSSLTRYLKEISDEYGFYVKYCHLNRGYFIDTPLDEDVSSIKGFIELLERRERMEFVNSTFTNLHDVGRYVRLEKNNQFKGTEHLTLLWEALRSQRVISFDYGAFDNPETTKETRTVEPGLLFEYKNRFYLDAWDLAKNKIRTFGLDRMSDVALTNQTVKKTRHDLYQNLRQHVIGVNCPPDSQPQRVLLRLTTLQAKYLHSLPLHHSQRQLTATATHVDFELVVVLNKELEIEILGMGEAVEVLEPVELREIIKERTKQAHEKYQK